MSISRPFAYNTGSTIFDTDQIGDLAIGGNALPYSENYGGVVWKNGPDEDVNYYVIGFPQSGNTQPLPGGGFGNVQFWRSETNTNESFIAIVEYLTNFSQTFANANQAQTWLTNNGYWTSFVPQYIPQILMELDSTTGVTGNNWSDISGNNRNGTLYNGYGTTTYLGSQVVTLNGSDAFVIPLNGFGTTMNAHGLTYEMWAYPTKTGNGTLISEWSGFPPTGWNDAQVGFVGGKINGGVYPNSFVPSSYLQGPNFSINTWYNIVLTYDVTSGGEKLYINGSLQGTTFGTKANPAGTTLTLGRPDSANSYIGGATGYFQGYVGYWRVWDGAINQTQVTNFYNTRKSLYGL